MSSTRIMTSPAFPSDMSSTLATVGILSIGEMGLGIAKLLVAHNYRVVTNISGRSADTQARARDGQVDVLSSDTELVQVSDYILSIVPPRDALFTAQRVITALREASRKETPLYFLELNAISPRTAREITSLFQDLSSAVAIDGGIIGGAPRLQTSKDSVMTMSTPQHMGMEVEASSTRWTRPSIPTSGPRSLTDAPKSGAHLASTLNTRHISPQIGTASGLKMCFASTTKGFIAICTQAFTTAHRLGVLSELKKEMADFIPATLKSAEAGVPGMPPKAYRWVREMEEIAATHAEEGGFERGLFEGIAEIYRAVAEDPVLGAEKTGDRKRGRTLDDVAAAMGEGLGAKRKKKD